MIYKKLLNIVFVFSLSNEILLAQDINISIEETIIIQTQFGNDLVQEVIVGVVSDDYRGNVTVSITNSDIIQTQNGNGTSQNMRVGTVGFLNKNSKFNK